MNEQITLLTHEQYFDDSQKLDIIKKYGTQAAITDFAILLGGFVTFGYYDYHTSDGNNLENRACYHWTKSSDYGGDAFAVADAGEWLLSYVGKRSGACRPALLSSAISKITPNGVRGKSGILEIEYGEYPQQAVSDSLNKTLEREFQGRRLKETGKTYTTDSQKYDDYSADFKAQQHKELEYNGKRYVRVVISTLCDNPTTISNGVSVKVGDAVWVEVQPIKWLVDEKKRILLSKKGIVAGVRFTKTRGVWDGNFTTTEMNNFMQTHLKRDMLSTRTMSKGQTDTQVEVKHSRKQNPYNFNFNGVSEEEIIKGAIEANVAVFLHGQSSEGKSARVKQLDPDCEILYLRNATPDSLNGKSAYNPETGGMIDIPPTWFKKLKEKCEREPDKIHIIFFDEITNALPAIQGMAYNIVLDKEVNGIWKLPENARVVAAGNDISDSLAANQLAEPLFNRFAHVYIQTSVEDWLRWAMTADTKKERLDYDETLPERKIHPSVYAYIAFKREQALRSPYTGERPNADPRKWEMASMLLYKTKQPEMIRALVGDELTRDFVEFCNQQVITLEDVIKGNYEDYDMEMNTSEKWATTVGLSAVDETNVVKVRNFVSRLNPEMVSVFDSLWTRGIDARVEKIAELRMIVAEAEAKEQGGMKR